MKTIAPMSRRRFIRCLAAAGAGLTCTSQAQNHPHTNDAPQTEPHANPESSATTPIPATPELRGGSEQIAILIYPGFTELDAFGPHYALAGMLGASVTFVAKTQEPIVSESGIVITPQIDFAKCAQPLDLLVVPGGMLGTLEAIQDPETMNFVRNAGRQAKMAGSVCTGSLILGAAGLLEGYKATSHWQTLDLLELVGATPSPERVVFDRDRVTGGGVTAGLDFGLELVRRYRGDFYAQGMQLLAQYDPQPPFPTGGNPATANPNAVSLLEQMHVPFISQARGVLKAAYSSSDHDT